MPDQSGFEVKGKFYPLTFDFRLGDPVLVEQVTNLEWPTFCDRLPDEDTDPTAAEDLPVIAGLLAVAVWHQHPQWRRDRVASYVEQLALDRVQFIAADLPDDEEQDPQKPTPTGKAGEKNSETKPDESKAEPESSDGGEENQNDSGQAG